MKSLTILTAALFASILLLGCSSDTPSDPSANQKPNDTPQNGDATTNTADATEPLRIGPNGGTLVSLPDDAASLELVHDAETGHVQAYVLDPDGQSPQPIAREFLELDVSIALKNEPKLKATPNLLTANTTITLHTTTPDAATHHHFSSKVHRLEQVKTFDATIVYLPTDASAISGFQFEFPKGN